MLLTDNPRKATMSAIVLIIIYIIIIMIVAVVFGYLSDYHYV